MLISQLFSASHRATPVGVVPIFPCEILSDLVICLRFLNVLHVEIYDTHALFAAIFGLISERSKEWDGHCATAMESALHYRRRKITTGL